MDKRTSQLAFKQMLAGIFFIGGLVLIVVFILTIGRGKGLAQPKFQVEVLFKNVGGIIEGAPARLSGVNIGNVSSIDFVDKEYDGRQVKLTLDIYTRYKKQLLESTRFAIRTEGILGEKLVEIYSVDGQPPIDINKPIIGEDPIDVQDLAPVFIQAAESFTKTANELNEVNLSELAEIMLESSRALLVTSEGLNAIMDELQEIAKKSKRLFDRIEQKVIDGDLFKVF